MELPAINDFANDDWRLSPISSLYSTIEFLKGEMNVKNELINKLLNRCNHCCERHTKSLNDDLNKSDYDDESYSSEKTNNDCSITQNILDHNNIRTVDDRYITSRTKDRINRLQNTNCHHMEELHDDNAINNNLKPVTIIGDSILNNINPRGISKEGNVNVKGYPGLTSDDMMDFINPTIRQKPDAIIIHVGTNEVNNDIDTLRNMETMVASIKKKSSHTKIMISSLLIRQDKRKNGEKVKTLNKGLKKFCEENLVEYISHENIDATCLGKGRLHPNKKGKAFLAKKFISCINNLN